MIRARALLACLALLLSGCECDTSPSPSTDAAPASPRAPMAAATSVILVVIDTTRAFDLTDRGVALATTPKLDAWAARGARFDAHRVVVPFTLPSVTSLLTGLSPRRHGVHANFVRWPPELVSLAALLGHGGYQSAAITTGPVLHGGSGVSIGFDTFTHRPGTEGAPEGYGYALADEMTDRALAWVDARDSTRPYFLFLHYFDPHYPYDAPEPHRDAFVAPGARPSWGDGAMPADAEAAVRRQLFEAHGVPDDDARLLRQRHLGEVRFVDQELDRLLRGLEERGELERAQVWITADHGETFFEHPLPQAGGYMNHGFTVYEGELRVPLVVIGRGVRAGLRVRSATSSLDVAPTLLAVAGAQIPAAMEGRSLEDRLVGERPDEEPSRLFFAEATRAFARAEGWPNDNQARAVTDGRYKLVLWPALDRIELYDLGVDPEEREDLWPPTAPGLAARATELRRALDAYAAAEHAPVAEPTIPLETIEQLRALGYAPL